MLRCLWFRGFGYRSARGEKWRKLQCIWLFTHPHIYIYTRCVVDGFYQHANTASIQFMVAPNGQNPQAYLEHIINLDTLPQHPSQTRNRVDSIYSNENGQYTRSVTSDCAANYMGTVYNGPNQANNTRNSRTKPK